MFSVVLSQPLGLLSGHEVDDSLTGHCARRWWGTRASSATHGWIPLLGEFGLQLRGLLVRSKYCLRRMSRDQLCLRSKGHVPTCSCLGRETGLVV